MATPTFMVFLPMKSLDEIDTGLMNSKKLADAQGEENQKKLAKMSLSFGARLKPSRSNFSQSLSDVEAATLAFAQELEKDPALAKKIKKVAVVAGVCHGFIGNRMLMPRQVEAMKLLMEGATPEQIEKAAWDTVPNVPLLFWCFRFMVGIGLLLIVPMFGSKSN